MLFCAPPGVGVLKNRPQFPCPSCQASYVVRAQQRRCGRGLFQSPHIPLHWGLKRLKLRCPGSLWTSKTITFSNHYQIRARKQQGSLCLDPQGPPAPPRQTQANAIQTSPSRMALPPRGPSPDGHRSSEVSVLQVTGPLFHRPRERPASRDFLATQGVLYSPPQSQLQKGIRRGFTLISMVQQ